MFSIDDGASAFNAAYKTPADTPEVPWELVLIEGYIFVFIFFCNCLVICSITYKSKKRDVNVELSQMMNSRLNIFDKMCLHRSSI